MNVKFKIGTKENLPKTNIIEGSWYLCKDTGELYYGSSNDQMILIGASTNLKTLEIIANNGLSGGGELNSANTSLTISHKENTPVIEGSGLLSDSGVITDIEFDLYGHPSKVIKSELELSNFGINSTVDDLNVKSQNISINGTNYKITRPISDETQISDIFAPSTSGSLGQILISAGENEPEWSDLDVIIPESLAGTELPQVSNIANVGTSNKYAREDHIHPKASYTASEVGAIPEGGLKTINNESLEGTGNIQTLQLSDFEDNFVKTSQIGKTNGVASLNESGIIPSDQLPSYVDDVIEVYAMYSKDQLGNLTNIKLYSDSAYQNEITKGESGKIYINIANGEPNYNFRWSGTSFNYLNTGGITIGEITGTAYDGKKGKDTTDKLNTHVLDYNNPHKVTKAQVGLENVDNTSDLNKPISTATQNALDKKVDEVQELTSQGGLTLIKYNNVPSFYTTEYTGYIVIKIPVTAPTPIFDLTLNIFASYKADNIKLYISGYSATSTGTFTTLATNQIGGQYNIPVQCGWGSDNNLRVIIGSETTAWKNHVITAELYTSKVQIFDPMNIEYTKETDISSYTQLRKSDYKLVDLQTFRDDSILTKDPDTFNMEASQTRCFNIALTSEYNPIGSGTLYGTMWLTRMTKVSMYHLVFKDHLTNTIYTRLWKGSASTGSSPRLEAWKKITPIDASGTSSQFIKGDGSLDSTEYKPVVINRSTTTNVISRRDFLYTVAETNDGKTGTLVIEMPLVTRRVYEFEVILGSYRYYHKPTSLFFHLCRDKNVNPYNNCVCTKVGSLSYEDIRIAEKTDGQNFCILIGNVDSTWHHEIIRIPELVEDVNYLDSVGLNIEATAYITTDESVFSKISNIPTNSYYDPSSSLSMNANLWGNKLETGNEDFSDKSLYIKGSTTGNWSKGLSINRTGDTSTGGAFLGAYGPNTGIPSHLCLGYAYNKSSVIVDLSTKKVAIGAGTLSPGSATFSEALTVDGKVQADGFKTESGTSAQFLKADGSIDSTEYASLDSPTFTGTPEAPTVSTSTNNTQIATTAYVKALLNESLADLEGSLVYKGTIGTSGTVTVLPSRHTVGWVYVVSTAGSYAGETCEVGDMIICVTTGSASNNSHWTVVQTNINGAVTGPSSSINGQVAVFNGSTGKVIKAVNASTLSVGSATNWTGKPSWIGSSKPTYTASEIGALANDGTAVSAEKVENALTLSVNSGTSEGTSKYTFNGSAAKSLNLVAGSNVTLTPTAGKLTISATSTTYDVFSSSEDGLVPAVAGEGKLLTSSTDRWISPIPFYVQVNGGGTVGNAAIKYNTIETPTSLQYKTLMFNFPSTVSVQATYPSGSPLDSERINVNFPNYFPNQYPLTITNGKGKGSNASYTGSASVTAEIPDTAFPLKQTVYTGNKTIEGGNIYYPSSTTTSAVTFTVGTFTDDDPDAVIIVHGTRSVTFSGTGVYKMKNLPLTGSAECYRVYCLSRMNTYQSNYGVYINCAEYESI